MRYPCLVVDHDDTVVNSTATVHYPCFVEYTGIYHPEVHYTLEEYIKYNFDPGVVDKAGVVDRGGAVDNGVVMIDHQTGISHVFLRDLIITYIYYTLFFSFTQYAPAPM